METMTEPQQSEPQSVPIKDRCDALRKDLHWIEIHVRSFKELPETNLDEVYPGQHAEMKAQAMLAVRAIEEARMRLGKVLQYAGDGTSVYDKA